MNKQSITNSNVRGSVNARSDSSKTEQNIDQTEIGKDLNLEINESQDMKIGNMSAKGNIAIVCLAIVIIIFIGYQILGL